jgi:transposase-like protein
MAEIYDPRVKAAAVAEYLTGRPPKDICDQYGISKPTLISWTKEISSSSAHLARRGEHQAAKAVEINLAAREDGGSWPHASEGEL